MFNEKIYLYTKEKNSIAKTAREGGGKPDHLKSSSTFIMMNSLEK